MEEFRGVLQSLGQDPTDDELHIMMKSVDTDQNGVVDFDEFVHMMRSHLHEAGAEPTPEDELKEVFNVFDRDKDGFISFEELKLAMINLGERMTNEELKAMMTAADSDGDGQISFPEFQSMMKQ
jgi:calmodulin